MLDSQIDQNLDFQRAMRMLHAEGDETTPERLFLTWRMAPSWPVRYPTIERHKPWYAGLENLIIKRF